MGCPKNMKTFLWIFSYEGPHRLTPIAADYSLFWTIIYKCELCHARILEMLQDVEMVRRGFDVDGLRKEGAMNRCGIGKEAIAKHTREEE